jgi:acetolactate synthase-1/2/3 large subunit
VKSYLRRSGAELLCDALEAAQVGTVFGLPGTQNVDVYEALRRSRLESVLATHELAASFMANGYARASGRPGVLLTIPGPGFTYAVTGLAEAFLDSAPLLHIVGAPARRPGFRHALQAIDQAAVAGPIVKAVVRVERRAEIPRRTHEALGAALAEEPGPVMLELSAEALAEVGPAEDVPPFTPPARRGPDAAALAELARLVAESRRLVLYVGQGAAGAAAEVRALAEARGAPVIATTAGRGVLSEEHPLAFTFDFGRHASAALNEVLGRADLVLALGCKFSHNGAHGFRLELPPERLVRVDSSAANLAANYPSRLALHADVGLVLQGLASCTGGPAPVGPGWSPGEVGGMWSAGRARLAAQVVEPRLHEVVPDEPAGFFAALERALPEEACLVTDSGLHQMLARRHYRVRAPRGLIVPTDLQSMGFAIPAAIGAKRAAPTRPVVALLGDGGLLMSGLELVTAVREEVPLTVIVFNDGHLGIIRLQQLGAYGRAYKTEVGGPRLDAFAHSVGASYTRVRGARTEELLRSAVRARGVHVVEVALGDRPALMTVRGRALGASLLRRLRAMAGLGTRRRRRA